MKFGRDGEQDRESEDEDEAMPRGVSSLLMPDYEKELRTRKSRMDASKKRVQQSVQDALAALKKLDNALGDASGDVRSFLGLGRKMQRELKKIGKHKQFQERVDRPMPQVKKSLRGLEKGRCIILKARRELESLFARQAATSDRRCQLS